MQTRTSLLYQQDLNLPSSAWLLPEQVEYIAENLDETARDAATAAKPEILMPLEEQ